LKKAACLGFPSLQHHRWMRSVSFANRFAATTVVLFLTAVWTLTSSATAPLPEEVGGACKLQLDNISIEIDLQSAAALRKVAIDLAAI